MPISWKLYVSSLPSVAYWAIFVLVQPKGKKNELFSWNKYRLFCNRLKKFRLDNFLTDKDFWEGNVERFEAIKTDLFIIRNMMILNCF